MWDWFVQGLHSIEFYAIMPHLQLTLFACFILLADFLVERPYKYFNAICALLGIGFSAFALGRFWVRGDEKLAFNGLIVIDSFFTFFGLLFLLATALVILMSIKYLDLEGEHEGEYYALILFAAVGMLFMAGGTDLVTLFIGLELMALCFYLLAGFLRRDRRSNEAALKSLLLGMFSSGILAYGFSLLYGVSGSTNIQVIAQKVAERGPGDPIVFLAMVAVAAGMFFKVAAVPFHMWAPDVYEGAPTPITAYISVASKAASFAMLLRLFLVPLGPLRPNWETLLAVIALATMTIGNLAALNQDNIKRLLAYSSIGHVGYILLGLVAGNQTGRTGIIVYLFVYTVMTIGAFAVVTGMRRAADAHLPALAHRHPAHRRLHRQILHLPRAHPGGALRAGGLRRALRGGGALLLLPHRGDDVLLRGPRARPDDPGPGPGGHAGDCSGADARAGHLSGTSHQPRSPRHHAVPLTGLFAAAGFERPQPLAA